MYKNILVAIDPAHEERHQTALAMARRLAEDTTAVITAITVVEQAPSYMKAELLPEIEARAGELAMATLRHVVGELSEIRTVLRHGKPANEILGYAEGNGVDCIVISSHRPGVADYFLGSTAARVVRHAQCSVHVMR